METLARTLLLTISIFITTVSCAQELYDINLTLKRKNPFEYAGFIIAQKMGFYAKNGLKVHINFVDKNEDLTALLHTNETQFSVLSSSSLISASKGAKIVYLLSLFQSSPLHIITDKKSGIKNIDDLKNKKIMLSNDKLLDMGFLSMMSSHGLTNLFKPVIGNFSVNNLTNFDIHALVSDEFFIKDRLKKLGISAIKLDLKHKNIEFYSELLATNKEFLKTNPDIVEAFMYATINGFKYTYKHLETSVEIIHEDLNQKIDKKALLVEAKNLQKISFDENDKFGTITKKRFQRLIEAYEFLGFINSDINIDNIWHQRELKNFYLTREEKEYLKDKHTIKVCSEPNWFPYSFADKNGKSSGISAKYIELIKNSLHVDIDNIISKDWNDTLNKFKNYECDIISSIVPTKNRLKFAKFTTPYIKSKLVAVTKEITPNISDLKKLKNKKIGVIKEGAFIEVAKKRFPNLDIVIIENTADGINKINNGEIHALIDTLLYAHHYIKKHSLVSLKIAGIVDDNWGVAMGIHKENKILLDIFEKSIKDINQTTKQKIQNEWISIDIANVVEEKYIKYLFIMVGCIFIIWLIWSYKVKRRNRLLNKYQKEIISKNKELEILATTDKLTGLINRLGLDDIINKLIENKNNFGVIMVDVDFFKNVNDKYGHQVGDEVLVKIASILKYFVRNSDYVGRWGGEEFLVVCLDIRKDSLVRLAEKLKKSIKEYEMIKGEIITCSFGVTKKRNKDTLELILKRADNALYISKNSGRNKVTFK